VLDFGSSLRQVREAQGLTLADAEKAIRVRSRWLRALEEGRLDELPGGSYPRVFLREYASYLGVDPALLLEGLPEPEPEISPRPEPPPLPPLPWRAIALVALVLGAAATGGIWALSSRGPSAPAVAPAPASHAASRPAAVKHVIRQRPAVAAPAVAAVAVLRAVRGDCWILVKSGDRIVWQGMLRQGGTLRLGLSKHLWVRLGAPWNLDLHVAGRTVGGLPHAPVNVVLSRAGLATVG
jgi:transcriptional regulator with XRE-family HTH domain